jgi:hypothetical protein
MCCTGGPLGPFGPFGPIGPLGPMGLITNVLRANRDGGVPGSHALESRRGTSTQRAREEAIVTAPDPSRRGAARRWRSPWLARRPTGALAADGSGKDGIATLQATLEIRGSEQLVRVLSRLERLPYVQAVRRVAR